MLMAAAGAVALSGLCVRDAALNCITESGQVTAWHGIPGEPPCHAVLEARQRGAIVEFMSTGESSGDARSDRHVTGVTYRAGRWKSATIRGARNLFALVAKTGTSADQFANDERWILRALLLCLIHTH